jgi:anti-sigma factor RsiW
MTGCPDTRLLHGLADGELDAANSVALEAHLKTCTSCAAELGRIEALQTRLGGPALRHRPPPGLAGRIDSALAAAAAPVARAPRRPGTPWLAGGALGAAAAALALLVAAPQLTSTGLEDELVADHVRSLLAAHVTDVATSDRHVVKPWFNGRIDFAPPVPELAGQGFPLVGGRLDYLQGKVVAAIVYKRRLHTVNLFVRPAPALAAPAPFTARRQGYSLARWTGGGLEYWAVSDVGPEDLEAFRRAFTQASRQP